MTWTGLLTVTTTSDNQQLQSDNKQSQSLSGNTNNLSLNDKQNQSQQINSSNHNSSTNILAGNSNQDQSHLNISKSMMSSSGTNDCTKIKFSSKGLTAQQLQLIEQLFKQSKNNKNVANANSTNNNSTSSSISTGASGTASGIASEATGKTASNNNPTLAPPAPLNPNIKKNNNGSASGKNHSRFEIQNGHSN